MYTRFKAPERVDILNFPVNRIREVTSPEGKSRGRRTYSGCAHYKAFLEVPNERNVRENLLADPGKRRIKPSTVYRDMLESLRNDPHDFEAKHGGFVIVASKAEFDESQGYITLHRPSIINGAQSQGVLADWDAELRAKGLDPVAIHPRFEIVVTSSDDLANEISIARNNQNEVRAISIAGARHQLDDLASAMATFNPDWQIRKDESNTSDELIDTEKLLQVATALMPAELCDAGKTGEPPKKVYSYSMRAKCLKEFVEAYNAARRSDPQQVSEKDRANVDSLSRRYDYYIGIAPIAWGTYKKWIHHPGWSGMNLRQGVDRERNQVIEVADGFVFPILAALAVFVEKKNDQWDIHCPHMFDERMLLKQVKMALGNRSIAGNPWNLGKSADAWAQIHAVAWTFKEMQEQFSRELAAARA